jgi:hypothetical protein
MGENNYGSQPCSAVLLPPSRQLELRNRGHEYELPRVRTERFKRVFVNRCLFNFI